MVHLKTKLKPVRKIITQRLELNTVTKLWMCNLSKNMNLSLQTTERALHSPNDLVITR